MTPKINRNKYSYLRNITDMQTLVNKLILCLTCLLKQLCDLIIWYGTELRKANKRKGEKDRSGLRLPETN